MTRHDLAFPFAIDLGSRQAARADYPSHVAQMVRQVLLTSPGERVNLPEFGCGVRALVFAGYSDGLAATTEILVRESLRRWLAEHLTVQRVEVLAPSAAGVAENEVVVRVVYTLLSSGTDDVVDVEVR